MSTKLPGAIIAGGKSLRMGGADKGLLPLAGRRVLDHVIDRLRTQCRPLSINANGDPSRYSEFGLPVFPDPVPGQPGPLGGLLAALTWAKDLGSSMVLTVAADTPFFPDDLAERLSAAAGTGICIAASPDETGNIRAHPVFGVWPVALRDQLARSLANGERRIGKWAEDQGAHRAVFASAPFDPFFNINTPEDLKEAERIAARVG